MGDKTAGGDAVYHQAHWELWAVVPTNDEGQAQRREEGQQHPWVLPLAVEVHHPGPEVIALAQDGPLPSVGEVPQHQQEVAEQGVEGPLMLEPLLAEGWEEGEDEDEEEVMVADSGN